MMRYVLLDMAPLVLLGFLIVVGFGFAFVVLFEDDFATDVAQFETPQRSFETLFHAMLGEFDSDVVLSPFWMPQDEAAMILRYSMTRTKVTPNCGSLEPFCSTSICSSEA